METPTFRIKPYAHPKYKFVVRAKLGGKWKRSYFRDEKSAIAYAQKQNAVSRKQFPVALTERSSGSNRRAAPLVAVSRQAVVVLGMHRSGTSALGGALNAMGIDFGPKLAPAGKDNEKGFWEHPEIVTLHEELLRRLNSNWQDDAPLPAGWETGGVAREIQALLRGVLERDFSSRPLFGLKDPRMCRLMPLWLPLFEQLRIDPKFVLLARHPWEVAQSLAKRDNLHPAKSYLLWLEHTFEAEAATRAHPRSFLTYEALLENPLGALGRLQEELGLSLSTPARTRNSVAKFLEPSLRHHRLHERKKSRAAVPSLAREVYEAFSAQSPAEISGKLSGLAEQFARSRDLFFPRINAVETTIANLDKQIAGKADGEQRENLVRLEVFHPTADGYRESNLEARYFTTGSWQLLQIDLPASHEKSSLPLRIDPASYPAVIDIAEIALKRAATEEILWSATSENDFADFAVAGTACRLFHEHYLRILSVGADPHVLLPAATAALLKTPTRLELLILVDNRLEAIGTSANAMQKQAEWKPAAAAAPVLTVHVAQAHGFSEEHSLRAPLPMDVMHTVRIDDFDSLCKHESVRLRIDPIDRPAAVTVSSIRIIRNSDDAILYAAQDTAEFDRIALSSGVSRHYLGDQMLVIATNSDPQLLLPAIENLGNDSLRLEVALEAHGAPPALLGRYRSSLREQETLTLQLRNANARLEQLEAASLAWETTFQELRTSLDASHSEAGRLTAETRETALEVSRLRKEIEEATANSAKIAAELESAHAQRQALETQSSRHLEEVRVVKQEIEGAREDSAKLLAQLESERAEKRALETQSSRNAEEARLLKNEVGTLETAVENMRTELESERSRSEERQAEIESAGQRISSLHLEIAHLHDLIAENRGQVSYLSGQLKIEETQHRERVSQLAAELESRQAEHREQVRELSGQLQAEQARNREQLHQLARQLEVERAGSEEQRVRLEHATRQLGTYQAEIENLQRALEGVRAEANQFSAELQAERTQSAATARDLTLANQASERALHESREETARLRAVLEIQRSNERGLAAYNARLQQRLAGISEGVHAAGNIARARDTTLPAICDLIAADLDRIHNPSFQWKIAKSFGLLRLARPGIPRTASDRRAIARELKEGLNEIRKILGDPAAAPEDVAFNIGRLFELRRRTREVASSLTGWNVLGVASPPWNFIHWARQTNSRVSEARPVAALFDPAWYLGRYPDVAESDIDPLTHYLEWGVQEARNPNAVFDTSWYLLANPDVAAAGINPLEHYFQAGAAEGRNPSPLFSTSWYLSEYPDVAAAGINPLQHYLQFGVAEGRNPHPLFDCAYYLRQYPEVRGLNPIEHFLRKGADGTSPHPLFDAKWYTEQYRDIHGSVAHPFVHYLETGWREGRMPHPLFDAAWYLERNQDARGVNPLIHYVQIGSQENRDPNPLFDVSWYRVQNLETGSSSTGDPLTHYLEQGAAEDRDPHPLFDSSWYLDRNPDVARDGVNPLIHFSIAGGVEGRDPHPLFDSSWYLETYPDVRESGLNPLRHYLLVGAQEGRDPHPLFQAKFYEEQRRLHRFSATELPILTNAPTLSRRNDQASQSPTGVIYAFTSVCLNYIPKAIVLAKTLKKHNPDFRFCVLISDHVPPGALDDIDVFDEVVTIQDLHIEDKPAWIFRHSVVELCTAVKGYFMVDLLERPDCAAAFYFDPDIVCMSSLDVLTDKLQSASILLTPHLTDPEVTTEAILDNEICALKHGIYNLGFLGVRPSSEGCRFARWWRDRLRDFCRADIPGGLFTDQRWVDLAPALFREIEIVRHPGCNAATWNLTNRNIEGDFTEGFTVNGEPLIFYHFSGFDSGAQGAMLDKYGGEMPAAQLLRKWYIEQTINSGDAHFAQYPWALGVFSNGEPISEAHRLLYRDRTDLQQAFPNPFDADTRGHSYYHWYHSEVLGRPIAYDGGGYIPLIEFIDAKVPFSPNPFFDCAWYLQHYPDVAADGLNPLVHFVVSGAPEGRQPSPGFYPAYYRTQLPPEERLENPLTHYLLRGLKENRRTDPRYHPVADAPLRNRLRRWAKTGPPLILLVSHYGGGGTEKHLRDLIDAVQSQAKFIQLTPGHDGFVRLSARDDDFSSVLVFDPAEQFQVLVEVLQECEPKRIHLHHILGNEEYLAALVRELRLPFDFTIHDYYVLAPSPHLVGPDAHFVGDDLEAHEADLLAASIARRRPSSLAEWQHAHSWLVTDADRVIAPSLDVVRRFQRFFPDLHPVLAAHPERNRGAREVSFPPLTHNDNLRVAILGDLLRHKGKDTILECAKIARAQGHKIAFELIGDAHTDSHLVEEAGIWASGRYQEDEVFALLKRRESHLIWYPALCPETFSYTLSIGLESGIPLVVTDLGSFPERVAGQPWSWVCPWQFTAQDWLDFFLKIREANFLTGVAPDIQPAPVHPTSGFYQTDYLAVLRNGQTQTERKTRPAGRVQRSNGR